MTAFVVPGWDLGRPPAVMRELWNASDPRHPAGDGWRRARAPSRLRWWWTLLVAALAADLAARGLALAAGGPLGLGHATRMLVLGQLLAAAAAVCGIATVLGTDLHQEEAAWRRAPAGEGR